MGAAATMPGREVGYDLPQIMAAAGIDEPTDATMQLLPEKRGATQRMLDAALDDILDPEKTGHAVCAFSRDGVEYVGGERGLGEVVHVGDKRLGEATVDDWNRVLVEGLGATFSVDWSLDKYDQDDLRVLRLGEPIFDLVASMGLNPAWDGTAEGDFIITAVDQEGANLALAMALHPRLGSESPLALVSSPVLMLLFVVPIKCRMIGSIDFGAGP